MRWSAVNVSIIVRLSTISPSTRARTSRIAPTPRIAGGRLITGLIAVIPNMPRGGVRLDRDPVLRTQILEPQGGHDRDHRGRGSLVASRLHAGGRLANSV